MSSCHLDLCLVRPRPFPDELEPEPLVRATSTTVAHGNCDVDALMGRPREELPEQLIDESGAAPAWINPDLDYLHGFSLLNTGDHAHAMTGVINSDPRSAGGSSQLAPYLIVPERASACFCLGQARAECRRGVSERV